LGQRNYWKITRIKGEFGRLIRLGLLSQPDPGTQCEQLLEKYLPRELQDPFPAFERPVQRLEGPYALLPDYGRLFPDTILFA